MTKFQINKRIDKLIKEGNYAIEEDNYGGQQMYSGRKNRNKNMRDLEKLGFRWEKDNDGNLFANL